MHKLETFSPDPGKVHFEILLHLLRYIRDNKTLGLKYYADINDAHLSELLRQVSINTNYQLVDFSDYSWKDCIYIGRSTGEYNIFYQGGPIYHVTHVPGTVSQSSAESEYKAVCTAGMNLAHLRIFIHERFNKDPDIVRYESTLIILDIKSAACMSKIGKDNEYTRYITRKVHLVRNGEK